MILLPDELFLVEECLSRHATSMHISRVRNA